MLGVLRFLILFALLGFAFAQSEAEAARAQRLKEPSIFDLIDADNIDSQRKKGVGQEISEILNGFNNEFAPTDEPNQPNIAPKIKPAQLSIKASNIPEQVYAGEIFSFHLLVDTKSDLSLSFALSLKDSDVKWLNQNSLEWSYIGAGQYSTTLYFQAPNEQVQTLSFDLSVYLNSEVFQKSSLSVFLPKIQRIFFDRSRYSHIVADELNVGMVRLRKFDEHRSIIMLELSGKNLDLKGFFIENPDIERQEIDTIQGNFSSQSAYYFAVINGVPKSFSFSYFNLKDKRLHIIEKGSLRLESDDVSTQLGLNPQESIFQTYKNIALFSLSAIFLLLAVFRRRLIYYIVAISLIFVSAYLYNPLNVAILMADSQVKILPIESSTIFYEQVGRVQKGVKIIDAVNDYYKIKFIKDGKSQVGWVRRENITKN